ncbi:M24 family metallopeptidase [Anaeromyxobacter oryzae]|uniref:Peptidase M24 n=1 Tax=Anaeromyxobacter oryzae TaxID=2918170 RepID=A0ABM7WT95_9BACT|nr:Xaa-Pro peptidase family protein [Anaeromyxobacter oryzae]BDG02700.1 peptidase M24 [Anaeromyxobacter oryzae]
MDTREHAERIGRLQEALRARSLSGALLLHAVDVFYLSGTRQNGALFVPAEGAALLLVRKSLARARAEAAIADVRPFPSSKELAGVLGAATGRVGATFDAVPQATLDWWRRQLPAAELVDVSGVLREQRSVKSAVERAILRDGGARIASVLAEVPRFLRAGAREIDVSAEIEARLRRAGNEGSPRLRGFNAELFVGIVAAGASASAPGYFDGPVVGPGLGAAYPQGASTKVIAAGEPVLLDFTGVFGGYVVDMTRIAVVGALAPELERAFGVALEIQAEVAGALRPGAIGEALWERARARAEAAGLGDRFMGPPGDQARFVGHGVGLELDELPVLAPGFKAPLVEGQVVAIEPKFVFPGVGAVGIENTWIVTRGGGEKVTALADEVLRVGA